MSATNRRQRIYITAALFAGLILAVVVGLFTATKKPATDPVEPYIPSGDLHEVVINTPPGVGTLRTGLSDIHDNPVGVACSTCHQNTGHQDTSSQQGLLGKNDRPLVEKAEELTEFHTDLEFDHGSLSCSSCHNPSDRDQLRLSDGNTVAFADVMQLCAQCHSSQYRSYERGAHGGMTGHWDLSKGNRVRNNCVACHNPHAPAFPILMPAAPPRDRFFKPDSHIDAVN